MTQDAKSLVHGSLHGSTLLLQIQPAHIRDPECSATLKQEMIAIADLHKTNDVLIDFSRVQFVGSVGVLSLMGLRRHLEHPNIILFGLCNQLKEVFEVCKMISPDPKVEAMFGAVDTLEEAQDLIAIRRDLV